VFFQEPEILAAVDAPISEKQLKEAAHAAVELPTVLVGIAVFYNLPGSATAFAFRGRCLRISTWKNNLVERPRDCRAES